MAQPTDERIAQLKAQHSDRQLHLIEAADGDESYHFVMVGPSKEEYRRFSGDVIKARETKGDEAEKTEALRFAVEKTALALIKWPDRDELRQLFDQKPAMLDSFPDQIHKAAGGQVEFRSKKL